MKEHSENKVTQGAAMHKRSAIEKKTVFRDRLNLMFVHSDTKFNAGYRINKSIFVQLQEKVVTFLHRSTTWSHFIPDTTQLAVARQFLDTGYFQTVVASSHGFHNFHSHDAFVQLRMHFASSPKKS